LVVSLIGFFVYVAMQPSEFFISRSIVINASAENVYNQVNEPRKVEEWSPWSKLDPNAKITYSGNDAGIGAIVSWSGNDEMGEGSETIIQSTPNESVRTKLEIIRPMQATYTGEFIIKQKSDTQVEVVWAMSGNDGFIARIMRIILNCNAMVGSMFEEGLNNLKTNLEKQSSEKA
jgi:hypothetical protein